MNYYFEDFCQVLQHLDWFGFCKLALWIILWANYVNHRFRQFFANCPYGQLFFANCLDDQFFLLIVVPDKLSANVAKIVPHHFSLICLKIIVLDNLFETCLSRQVVRVRVVRMV